LYFNSTRTSVEILEEVYCWGIRASRAVKKTVLEEKYVLVVLVEPQPYSIANTLVFESYLQLI
jgi:hypothetical protein